MNICFLVEDSNISKMKGIKNIGIRIIGSLQNSENKILHEDEEYGIYKLSTEFDEDMYIECYRIKDYNKYLINAININEDDKNNLIEIMASDRLFENNIILIDFLSNDFITKEYEKFMILEQNMKQYFISKLIDRYGGLAYQIIDNIKTKEDLIHLPNNIRTNIQRVELLSLVEYMLDKPLGGMEYDLYFEEYDKDNLKPLKEILNENIFKDIKQIIHDNRNIIKEYRNIICHNRFLNCNNMQNQHCKKINDIIAKLLEVNNKWTNGIFNTKEVKYYDDGNNNRDKERFTFALKRKVDSKKDELLLINILSKLNYIYDKEYLIKEKDICKYSSNIDNISIYMSKLDNINNDLENIFLISIEFSKDSYEKVNLNDIILNEYNDGDIIILYDSLSMTNALRLARKFTLLENLLREYITLFQYIENINDNNKKDNMASNLRIGLNGNSLNSIYDLNFIELLNIITAPNGGKNMPKLISSLREAINNEDIDKIEFLLNNMLDYNNDLKVIVTNWCELYKFRTIVAHCQTLFSKDCTNIENIINSTRMTVENILSDYLINNTKVFNYIKYIKLEKLLNISENSMNNRTCDISFIKYNAIDSKYVSKVENLFVFRINQIINKIINDEDNLEYVFSYEYLIDKLQRNNEKIINFINDKGFESNLSKILETLGFDDYADFRIVTNQMQILEEKIGNLLENIHAKMHKGN